MGITEAGRLAIKLEGLKVSRFFDRGFVEKVREKMGEAKFTHFCIMVESEREDDDEKPTFENVYLIHSSPEEFDDKVGILSASEPELLQKFLAIIQEHMGE